MGIRYLGVMKMFSNQIAVMLGQHGEYTKITESYTLKLLI